MSLNPSKKTLKVIKFSDFYGNLIPLLKIRFECPKLGRDKLVLGLIDTGSRYTVVNKYTANECFTEDEMRSRYVDRVIINNREYYRYSFRFSFPQLDEISWNFNAAIIEYNPYPEEIVPAVILGREDFLRNIIVCMYKSEWMTLYID
ncbi:hypothetical protein STK_13410 [Sulfurisphaera tokodaii str. 7]|uniref:Peptidase A2 domain-containing protein n=1 Tax=Sulfurisphaera tokodaii (strain DSM 16993 / JCM 10545 / NBRC 100140 / 7) TaxID=273063 RepID=Q971M0_SULTO|nr:hypothetical protein [Sulfurisphaera tokodaii]BAB66400.1 hypothetical protein STK_13410 [Sulfurisphaera tokodaii str. 7]